MRTFRRGQNIDRVWNNSYQHRHQVRGAKERLRETAHVVPGRFRGWADERIVNSIYCAPQIRLTSSLAIKMIVDPLEWVSRHRIAAPAFHPLRLAFRVYSLPQKYSSLVTKRKTKTNANILSKIVSKLILRAALIMKVINKTNAKIKYRLLLVIIHILNLYV